ENDFKSPVVVNISQRKRTTFIEKIQSNNARNFGKRIVAIVGKENVPLKAIPRRVGSNEFVDRVPSSFVIGRRTGILRRLGHYLPPKEAGDVRPTGARNIAIRNIEVSVAIVVKVPGIGRPSPAAHFHSGWPSHVLKFAVPLVAIQRVTGHVTAVAGSDLLPNLVVEMRLSKNAHTIRHPH